MSVSKSYELNVTYWCENHFDLDGQLTAIATEFGYQPTGSGAGPGYRDMTFARPTRPSDDELQRLKGKLRAFDNLCAYLEVWPEGDGVDPIDDEMIELIPHPTMS